MRHLYRCPMRWADLDLLGHVNNVVYVDYLQEARVDMMRTHAPDTRAEDLAEGVVVVRHEVSYLTPLTYRMRPVSIECWVTELRAATFTMAYEVFDEDESGARTVYVRARTVLTPYVFSAERPRRLRPAEKEALGRFLEPDGEIRRQPFGGVHRLEAGHFPVHVRFSDVDVYGHVNNVKYFEYLQESRIPFLARLGRDVGAGMVGGGASEVRMVVAQTDVDYRVPILLRERPYDSWTWLSHVGRTSVTFETALCDRTTRGDRTTPGDADTVLSRARVVGVFFDPATGRATPPPEDFRDAMLGALAG